MSHSETKKGFLAIDLNEMRPKGFLKKLGENSLIKCQKVSEKQGWRTVEYCPVCNSKKRKLEFSKFNKDIYCCEECDLRYFGEIPAQTEDIYSDGVYLPNALESYMKNVEYRRSRFGKERIELIKSQINSTGSVRLLDIGCGVGWFLEMAIENGFEAYGQDLGKEVARWTSQRLGVKIWNCGLSELGKKEYFDVITMFDVLEHVPDPCDLLLKAKELLKKEGIIIVLTPNFDSVAISIMKEKSQVIAPGEHLTFFTKKSAVKLAEKANLAISYFATKGVDLGDLKSYYELLNERDMEAACGKLYNELQPVIDAAEAGNHLRIVFRKKA